MLARLFLKLSTSHPRWVVTVVILITIVAGLQMPRIQIDTDPENMLPADEAVRVTNAQIKEEFALYDFLVVGIVDEESVFTPEILGRAQRIVDALYDIDGVVVDDILAPSEVDDIVSGEDGEIRVETLMESVPETDAEAKQILVQILENPILRGKLASEDGRALAIFVPLESKDVAMEVGDAVRAVIAEDHGDEQYFLAGQPVAQDTFGAAMFVQMAYSAPAAFVLIFLLLLYFFRRPSVVLGPMILAMITVIWTMGLLIGMGYTVHIMSSMIPIFLIPIVVLDSIHILSAIHVHHRPGLEMRDTLRLTFGDLFVPMALTSLTTVVGFAALIATPIPPVQVFGAFVATGVFFAWILSMVFLPAYTVLLPAKTMDQFAQGEEHSFVGGGRLRSLGRFSVRNRVALLVGLTVVIGISILGVTRVVVNDNPVNWFKPGSPIRVADRVMNEHLSGTYLAYLHLAGDDEGAFLDPVWMNWVRDLEAHVVAQENVGAASSVVDILKKVQYELLDRSPGSNTLGDTREKIAQYLFLYEISGGTPDDLFKFITPEQDGVNIWVQMRQGDNQRVSEVVQAVADYSLAHPMPPGMRLEWGGLTYINVEWQRLMVSGMAKALGGSYVTVMIMMMVLFRSVRMGLLAMLPLTATILVTYGYVGWTGRNYDMPIAVLSSLSLGLSIDFAIHFLQRTRDIYRREGQDFNRTMEAFFDEPAQALVCNIVVIALGFVPMFFATLMPYVTVGAFFFAIMLVSGGATLLTMPAALSFFPARSISGQRTASRDTAASA